MDIKVLNNLMQPASPTAPKPKPPEPKDDFTLGKLYTDKVDYLHKSIVDKLHAQLLQVRIYSEVTRVVEPPDDNYRSWMKTPQHPDPDYPLEVLELLVEINSTASISKLIVNKLKRS